MMLNLSKLIRYGTSLAALVAVTTGCHLTEPRAAIAISASIPNAVVAVGDTVVVNFTVTNTSGEDVEIQGNTAALGRVEVRMVGGAWFTVGNYEPDRAIGFPVQVLPPTEGVSTSAIWIVRQFDGSTLGTPGHYEVRIVAWSRSGGHASIVASNLLALTVTP